MLLFPFLEFQKSPSFIYLKQFHHNLFMPWNACVLEHVSWFLFYCLSLSFIYVVVIFRPCDMKRKYLMKRNRTFCLLQHSILWKPCNSLNKWIVFLVFNDFCALQSWFDLMNRIEFILSALSTQIVSLNESIVSINFKKTHFDWILTLFLNESCSNDLFLCNCDIIIISIFPCTHFYVFFLSYFLTVY